MINTISFSSRLFTTDIDGTWFIPPEGDNEKNMQLNVEDRYYDYDAVKRAQNAIIESKVDNVLLNTGRNFTELSEIKDNLETSGVPINAISINDGKILLVKPRQITSQQWLTQLFDKDINYMKFSDKKWNENNNSAIKLTSDYLMNKKGYIHRKDKDNTSVYSKKISLDDNGVKSVSDKSRWEISITYPDLAITLNTRDTTDEDKVDVETYNKEITNELKTFLEDCGYKINKTSTKKEVTYTDTFNRADINKGSVADYYKQTLGTDVQEVCAGNAYNDVPMLHRDNVAVIQVGSDEVLSDELNDRVNVIKVKNGCLDEGIKKAFSKFDVVV